MPVNARAQPETAVQLRDRLDRAIRPVLADLRTPALLVDLDAVDHNLNAMVARAASPDRWRPHIKTLKQSRVIDRLLAAGVRHLKCATLDELTLLLELGRDPGAPALDLLWAYAPDLSGVRGLASRLARLDPQGRHRISVLADDPDHFQELARTLPAAPRPVGLIPDVDVGMGRTGQPVDLWLGCLQDLRGRLEPSAPVRLAGLHAYEGHLEWDERDGAFAAYASLRPLIDALTPFTSAEAASLQLVTSGTHAFEHALSYPGFDALPPGWRHQVSPGTLVLGDLRSYAAAARLELRPAAFVATRVVSRSNARITLDAGSKAISPDVPAQCGVVLGAPQLVPQPPSEEHLPTRHDPRIGGQLPERGELLFLVPTHVCTTVNLHRGALYLRGDRIVGHGPIEAASRSMWADAAPLPESRA